MHPLLARATGPFADLPKPIWALFFANVVNYAGNFVWPLLTLLLTDRLGMSPERASLFFALGVMSHMPGTALGGKLADHFGRKRVCVLSHAAAALTLLPCAFLGASEAVIWLVLASRLLGSMAEPAINAMAADLVSGPRRGGAVSLLYLGLNLGFSIGPLVAGVLYRDHLAWLFLGDALTTLLSVVIVQAFVPETLGSRTSEPAPEAERPSQGSLFEVLLSRPQLLPLGIALTLFSMAYVQCGFSLPLQTVALFGEGGPKAYGLLMAVNGITVVAATPICAWFARRVRSLPLVAFGGALYAVGFGAVGLASGVPGLAATTVVWSVGEVFVATNWRVFVADQSPSSHRARLSGGMQIVSGTGFLLGPLVAGRLATRVGLWSVWAACFAVAVAGAVLLWAFASWQRRAEGLRKATAAP